MSIVVPVLAMAIMGLIARKGLQATDNLHYDSSQASLQATSLNNPEVIVVKIVDGSITIQINYNNMVLCSIYGIWKFSI